MRLDCPSAMFSPENALATNPEVRLVGYLLYCLPIALSKISRKYLCGYPAGPAMLQQAPQLPEDFDYIGHILVRRAI
jgi:hypothetical protein